jgi:diguanylate cyclase (GGDEF)-like protein/PAS domain S-box-containing protein
MEYIKKMSYQPDDTITLERREVLNTVYLSLVRNWNLWDKSFGISLAHITRVVADAMSVQRVSVWFLEKEGAVLSLSKLYDAKQQAYHQGAHLLAADYRNYFAALDADRVIAATDAHSDHRTHEFSKAYLAPLGIGAMLDATLRIAGRTQGVLCIEHVGTARLWNEEEKRFAVSVADLLAQLAAHYEVRHSEARLREITSLQKAVLDGSNYSIISTAPDGTILSFNAAAERMLGYSAEDVVGKCTPDIFHDYDEVVHRAAELSEEIGQPISPGFEVFVAQSRIQAAEEREWTYVRKDGSRFPVLLSVTTLRSEDGSITGFLGIASDLTDRKNAEERKIREEQLFSQIAHGVANQTGEKFFEKLTKELAKILEVDIAFVGELVDDSEPAIQFLSFHSDEFAAPGSRYKLNGTPCADVMGRGLCCYQNNVRSLFPEDKYLVEKEIESYLGIALYASDDRPLGILVVLHRAPLSEPKLAENLLRIFAIRAASELERRKQQQVIQDKEAHYRTLFEATSDAIFLMKDGIFVDCNPATLNIFGCVREQIVGHTPYRFSPELQPNGRSSETMAIELIEAAVGGKPQFFEWCHLRCDGTPFDAEVTLKRLTLRGEAYLHATVRDITERKKAEKQIEYLAFYDPITELPNRRLFLDRLQQDLASSERNNRQGAVLLIDLDNFKTINDTLGHDIGDLLLHQVGGLLTNCVREGDTVARFGGDEFVVVLSELGMDALEAAANVEAVGEKILFTLNRPYQLAEHEIRSTASIGAVLFNDMQLPDDLIKQADIAMYQAKKAGRNTMRFFDPEMQHIVNTRAVLEDELHRALANQQFQLHYQIQVDSSGNAIGAEALIRWEHPEYGLVSPANFITLAEDTGLILPIGLWVLETACVQLKIWQQQEQACNLVLSVNVSPRQFRQTDFVAQVRSLIQRHSINPRLLKLEITESMLLNNIEKTISTMNALNEIGIQISLDDFGTGYSSMQYLKRLPLKQIKIDQSFVHDIAVNDSDKAIVGAIIAMAHSLNLNVIAEGVETEAQRQLLLDKGCTHYQGYLYGEPVPIERFETLLKKS